MAYTAIPTQNTGDTVTAADFNSWVKGNFEVSIPDIFTAAGQIAVASAADAAGVLAAPTSSGLTIVSDTSTALQMAWGAISLGGVYARAHSEADQTISNASATIVRFDTEDSDTASVITTGASWKTTIPAGQGGKYLVTGSLRFKSSANWAANEYGILAFYKNGSLSYVPQIKFMQAAGTYLVGFSFFGILDLAAADYIDLRVTQNSGGDIVVDGQAIYTHVAIIKLSV